MITKYNKTAVIALKGNIAKQASFFSGLEVINSDLVNFALKEAKDKENIILKIDSPGGELLEAEKIVNVLTSFKKENNNKIYAFNAGTLASASYLIALQTDKIYSDNFETPVIGSIGVMLDVLKIDNEKELALKGHTVQTITSGEYKIFNEKTAKEEVDTLANNFFSKVSQRRNIPVETIKEWQGKSFSSGKALELGLIDKITNLEALIAKFEKSDNIISVNTTYQNSSTMNIEQILEQERLEKAQLAKQLAEFQAKTETLQSNLVAKEQEINKIKHAEINKLRNDFYCTAQTLTHKTLDEIKASPEYKHIEQTNDPVVLNGSIAMLKSQLTQAQVSSQAINAQMSMPSGGHVEMSEDQVNRDIKRNILLSCLNQSPLVAKASDTILKREFGGNY